MSTLARRPRRSGRLARADVRHQGGVGLQRAVDLQLGRLAPQDRERGLTLSTSGPVPLPMVL
jgi:hypothetical protein